MHGESLRGEENLLIFFWEISVEATDYLLLKLSIYPILFYLQRIFVINIQFHNQAKHYAKFPQCTALLLRNHSYRHLLYHEEKIFKFPNHKVAQMSLLKKITSVVFLLLFVCSFPFSAHSEVDWEISGAIQLDHTPIDVARTQGDELTFLLTDNAQVLIYNAEGKLVGSIPVDPAVTDIAVSAKGEQLYLINSKRKSLKTVQVSFIVDFNTEGSPFLGSADAKIVVAVFSDFQ